MSAIRFVVVAAAALAAAACGADAPTTPSASVTAASAAKAGSPSQYTRDLAAARAASARYHRVEAAVAAGYAPQGGCVAVPGLGGMGIHYVNMGMVLDNEVDPSQPEVLVYQPEENGTLRLVAVEYMVAIQLWEMAHPGTRPVLFGAEFEDGPPGTYALHAWVWKHNASGMLAPFNPTVSCPTPDAVAASAHASH